MKIMTKYNLLIFCVFIRMPSTFAQIDASQRDNCNSTEVTKTYVKGWQSYVSLGNAEIRNLIKAYCDDFSAIFTLLVYENKQNKVKLMHEIEKIDSCKPRNFGGHNVKLEPSNTTKKYVLDFVSPDQCLNIDYTIFYENENEMICGSHSNFTAKREKIEHTNWFEMNCVDELQNFIFDSPFEDEYKISWYKDCYEISENKTLMNNENIRLHEKTLEVNFEDHSLDGVYFCKLSLNNVSMVTKLMKVTYEPQVKHIPTVFNASGPCTSTNQKVEALKFKPITVKKEFLVSGTDYTTSWYKLNGTVKEPICVYLERIKKTIIYSEEQQNCTFKRVQNKENNTTKLVTVLQIKNVTEEDYGKYQVRVALGHHLGESVYCNVTVVPYVASKLLTWILIAVFVFTLVIFTTFLFLFTRVGLYIKVYWKRYFSCSYSENCRVYFLYDLKQAKDKTKKKLFFMINYCEEKLEKLGCEIVDEFKSGIVIGNYEADNIQSMISNYDRIFIFIQSFQVDLDSINGFKLQKVVECSMKEKNKIVFVLSKNVRKFKKGKKTEKDAKKSLINQVLEKNNIVEFSGCKKNKVFGMQIECFVPKIKRTNLTDEER